MHIMRMLWAFVCSLFQVLLFGPPKGSTAYKSIRTSANKIRYLTDSDKEQIAAAKAKRERKALDIHGMRFGRPDPVHMLRVNGAI